MTQISGMELESFGGGGAVNEGRAIWAKMRLFDGQEHGEMVILIDHERFPFELLALLDYAAIAREERLKRDPGGEAAGRVTGSVAFPISDVLDGAPINYPGHHVVIMQVNPGTGRLVNLAFTLDRNGLERLLDAAQRGLVAMEQAAGRKPSAAKKLN